MALAACSAADEVEFEESCDVVDDGLGLGDFGVAGGAHGLEAHALEADDGVVDGQAVLDGEGEGAAECLAHAGHGGAFLGHFDEELAGRAVGVEADGEVALVITHAELVGDGGAGFGEDAAHGEIPGGAGVGLSG